MSRYRYSHQGNMQKKSLILRSALGLSTQRSGDPTEKVMTVGRIQSSALPVHCGCLVWCPFGIPNSKIEGLSDPFICSWDPFFSTGIHHPALI